MKKQHLLLLSSLFFCVFLPILLGVLVGSLTSQLSVLSILIVLFLVYWLCIVPGELVEYYLVGKDLFFAGWLNRWITK